MRNRMSVVFLVLLIASCSAAAADTYREMQRFLDVNFRGEGFSPTPYGADGRFAPKTIWIYAKHAQDGFRSGKQAAWIVFNDGRSVYPEALVPLRSNSIDVQAWALDQGTGWGLAAALAGTVGGTGIDAAVDLARERGLRVEIELGEVEIQYGEYFDFLVAQETSSGILNVMDRVLRSRFRSIPKRRVVTAALRARNVHVRIAGTSSTGASLDAAALEALAKLGFHWRRESNSFSSLEFEDWRYVAYQAMRTDEFGKISSAGENEPARADFSYPDEVAPWREPMISDEVP